MEYGFEKEYFVSRGEVFGLCPPSIPRDACGYLAESRGAPYKTVMGAAFLLMAEEKRMLKLAEEAGYNLVATPYVELPQELLRRARRTFGKGVVHSSNLYGKDYPLRDKFSHAGLHVHFSDKRQSYAKTEKYEWWAVLDIPKYVHGLDVAFAKEIKEAKRIPGSYEMKPYGFEYRSLPNDLDPVRVAEVIQEIEVPTVEEE